MVDAGIGALRQLHRKHIDSDEIDAVLITHWHFDHFAGLRALLKSRKRSSPLLIYGPKLSAPARMYLMGVSNSAAIRFETAAGGFSKECGDILIEAVPTVHDIVSIGWVLTEKLPAPELGGRRIVISGDTRPTEAIVDAAQGADLLVHEATYPDGYANTAMKHKHSTVTEAANLGVKAGVGALALTHMAHRYTKLNPLKEAETIFPQVLIPSPLDTFSIEPVPDSLKMHRFGWGNVRLV